MAEDKLQWKKMSNGDIEWSLPDMYGSVPSFVVDAITADLKAQVAHKDRVIEVLDRKFNANVKPPVGYTTWKQWAEAKAKVSREIIKGDEDHDTLR